jgi:hypothetical protein
MRLALVLTLLLLVLQISEGIGQPLGEVPASEILINISKGLPVEYDHIVVTGNLILDDLKGLPTRHVDRTDFEIEHLSASEEKIKIISPIKINDSIIDGIVSFNNTVLENLTDFGGSTFNSSVDFWRSTFNGYADFNGATLGRIPMRQRGTFFVDQIVLFHAFSAGDATMCFTIYHPDRSGDMRQLHPNKDFEDDPTTIDAQKEFLSQPGADGAPFALDNVELGSQVQFELGLDDDWSESCGSPEDSFPMDKSILTVKRRGQQRFVDENSAWDFVVKCHWEPY